MVRTNRDNFSADIIDTLAKRAGYICSNPSCQKPLIAGAAEDAKGVTHLGHAAHITAAAPGGPRYDSSLTPEQRASLDNAIYLCPTCASLIDKNNGQDYPVSTLEEWKQLHEHWVRNRLNQSVFQEPDKSVDSATLPIPRVPPMPPDPWTSRPEYDVLRAILLAGDRFLRVALEGTAGIGKTMLAAKLAQDPAIQTAFPDGILWATLGPEADEFGELARIAASFQITVPAGASLQAQADLVQRCLAGRRCFLLVDDVWDVSAAEHFRQIGAAATLVTTRDHAVARAFASASHIIQLTQLSVPKSVALLHALVPAADGLSIVSRIADLADGLPLTLQLIAPLLDDELRMGWGLTDFLTKLESPGWRGNLLDEIVGKSLAALSPEDQAAFAQLAVFGASPADFALDAVLAVWDCSVDVAQARLREFVRRYLVARSQNAGRFALHQALADVAFRRLASADPGWDRHRAYFLGVIQQHPSDFARQELEVAQVRRAWRYLPDDSPLVLDYASALQGFHDSRGLYQEALEWASQALRVAETLQRPTAQATLLNRLGELHQNLGNWEQAHDYLARARDLSEQVGNSLEQALAFAQLAGVHGDAWNLEEASHQLQQAVLTLQQWDSSPDLAPISQSNAEAEKFLQQVKVYLATVTENGRILFESGASPLGAIIQATEDLLPFIRSLHDPQAEAELLNTLGQMYSRSGNHEQAAIYHKRALILCEEANAPLEHAHTLVYLGENAAQLGNVDEALAFYTPALTFLEGTDDQLGKFRILAALGRIHAQLGDMNQAYNNYKLAQATQQHLNNPLYQLIFLIEFATVCFHVPGNEQIVEGIKLLLETYAVEERITNPNLQQALRDFLKRRDDMLLAVQNLLDHQST